MEAAVQKMLGLIATMDTWLGFTKLWLKNTAVMSNGAREVATRIVADSLNNRGFRNLSAQTKASIVDLLMASEWENNLLAKVAQLNGVCRRDQTCDLWIQSLRCPCSRRRSLVSGFRLACCLRPSEFGMGLVWRG